MDQSNPQDRSDHVTTEAPPSEEFVPAPPPPVSARAWLVQNGPWVVLLAVALIWAYQSYGGEWLLAVAKMVLGLGFIVFIHELGHFLAAKWCDVHVVTFSIGFGPALPGCSFQRGETTYKLAMLPLGGYVHMIGEGPEADEDENYPRSFKNKSVGARMLIISAGVIMNVLFGALCFMLVYRYLGVEKPPAMVWQVEPGSQAWKAGVRGGWRVTKLNNRKDPTQLEMKREAVLSSRGTPLSFEFLDRDQKAHSRQIEPVRDENAIAPAVGIAAPFKAQLVPETYKRAGTSPVMANSAAARARVLDLGKDDVVLQVSDPAKDNALQPLPSGEAGWRELCKRLGEAADKPLTVEVARGGDKKQIEKIEVPAVGFDWGDQFVAMTDPATPDRPYNLKPLDTPDAAFVFRETMARLAGKAVVVAVRRAKAEDGKPVPVLVPPAFHVTLGARMKMGRIAAVREGSPAAAAGLKTGAAEGDALVGVTMRYDAEKPVVFSDKEMDPTRLPFEIERRLNEPGRDPKKWRVVLRIKGAVNHDAQKERTLDPMEVDPTYSTIDEEPTYPWSALSLPQLGIAYWVDSTVVSVEPGGPAADAGLLAGDVVQEICIRKPATKKDPEPYTNWIKMASKRGREKAVYDQWAKYFGELQQVSNPTVKVKVNRPGEAKNPVEIAGAMTARPDETWPLTQRGFSLDLETELHKVDTLPAALSRGTGETVDMILSIYQTLRGLFTGQISPDSLGGPIVIARQGYLAAGENLSTFLAFLGMISINLAVVNFLPIPVLDGGHMVFLIYEKLRGRAMPEWVRGPATYVGAFLLLVLMVWVFWKDIVDWVWRGR